MNILIASPTGVPKIKWPAKVTCRNLVDQNEIDRHLDSNPKIDVLIVTTTFVMGQYDCFSVVVRAIELSHIPNVLLVRTREHESSLMFICEIRERLTHMTEVAVMPLFSTSEPEVRDEPGGKKSRGAMVSPQWSEISKVALQMAKGREAARDPQSYSRGMADLYRGFHSLTETHKRALVFAADQREIPDTNKMMAEKLGIGVRSYNNDIRSLFSTLGIVTRKTGPIALVDVASPIREWLLSYGMRHEMY